MKAEIRLPKNYVPYKVDGEPIYSNLTKAINYEVAEFIKGQPLSAAVTAWDFLGSAWWNDDIGYWCVEIWRLKSYRATHISESLEDLIEEIRQEYGTK